VKEISCQRRRNFRNRHRHHGPFEGNDFRHPTPFRNFQRAPNFQQFPPQNFQDNFQRLPPQNFRPFPREAVDQPISNNQAQFVEKSGLNLFSQCPNVFYTKLSENRLHGTLTLEVKKAAKNVEIELELDRPIIALVVLLKPILYIYVDYFIFF
jgi:hypothetical protein